MPAVWLDGFLIADHGAHDDPCVMIWFYSGRRGHHLTPKGRCGEPPSPSGAMTKGAAHRGVSPASARQELHRCGVGGMFAGIIKGGKRKQHFCLDIPCFCAALKGVRDEPIGKLGVFGERGPM